MPVFGKRSRELLATCDQRLVRIMNEVVRCFDISVVSGHRGEEEQNELYRKGMSKLKFPHSNHNSYPSKAVDVAPWDAINNTVDWEDTNAFMVMVGHIQRVAWEMDIPVRFGSNWDMDYEWDDDSFFDAAHVELL